MHIGYLTDRGTLTDPSSYKVGISAELVRQVKTLLLGRIILAVRADELVGLCLHRRIDLFRLHELIYSRPINGLIEDTTLGILRI